MCFDIDFTYRGTAVFVSVVELRGFFIHTKTVFLKRVRVETAQGNFSSGPAVPAIAPANAPCALLIIPYVRGNGAEHYPTCPVSIYLFYLPLGISSIVRRNTRPVIRDVIHYYRVHGQFDTNWNVCAARSPCGRPTRLNVERNPTPVSSHL